jgi:hypothetical protein
MEPFYSNISKSQGLGGGDYSKAKTAIAGSRTLQFWNFGAEFEGSAMTITMIYLQLFLIRGNYLGGRRLRSLVILTYVCPAETFHF